MCCWPKGCGPPLPAPQGKSVQATAVNWLRRIAWNKQTLSCRGPAEQDIGFNTQMHFYKSSPGIFFCVPPPKKLQCLGVTCDPLADGGGKPTPIALKLLQLSHLSSHSGPGSQWLPTQSVAFRRPLFKLRLSTLGPGGCCCDCSCHFSLPYSAGEGGRAKKCLQDFGLATLCKSSCAVVET